MLLDDRANFFLQPLAFGQLMLDQCLPFIPVAGTGALGFLFILLPDGLVLAGDPKPDALKSFWQSL